jgi:sugar phosphate isomerase/epimerase
VNAEMSRRAFLKSASAMSLMTASGVELSCGDHEVVPGNFRHALAPAGDAYRISLNVYSFNRMLNDQIKQRGMGTSLMQLLDFCKEQKFDAIDPTGYYWWNDATATGYPIPPSNQMIDDFRNKAADLGIAVSGTGVRNNFASPYAEQRASDLRTVRAWCEVAARLGAPVLRVFAGPLPLGYGWDQVSAWMVDALHQCAEYGKEHQVIIGVQNHGDMLRTANQCIKVAELVDSEWFGLINDTGYFLTSNPYDDIARIMPYSVSLQVKESVRAVKNFQAAWTELKLLAKIIKDSGYRGFLPIETLEVVDQTPPYDPYEAAPKFRQLLRDALDGIEAVDPNAGSVTGDAGSAPF